MSSFATLHASEESSRPLRLYVIASGSTTYRYNSTEVDLVVDGDTYLGIAVAHTNLSQSRNDKKTVTVTVPADNEFARRYAQTVPGLRATLTIFELEHDESPSFNTKLLIFKGRVFSVGFSEDYKVAKIYARGFESEMARKIPRWTFQGICNHIVYDTSTGCNADPNDPNFKVTGTITGSTGSILTVDTAGSRTNGWWNGGFCQPSGIPEFRLILGHSGNDLNLLYPFQGDLTGLSVTLQAGCNHVLIDDCSDKFDRAIDYGGFFFTPKSNPFERGVL